MKSFRICPRCNKKYVFKRHQCSICKFIVYPYYYCYEFITYKYIVVVEEFKFSVIFRKETRPDAYGPIAFCYPASFKYTIAKSLSPKSTDEDIDKLLLLI